MHYTMESKFLYEKNFFCENGELHPGYLMQNISHHHRDFDVTVSRYRFFSFLFSHTQIFKSNQPH